MRQMLAKYRGEIVATLSFAFALTLYIFVVTAGRWTRLSPTTRYYDELASAFSHGHLYLDLQPPATLLALPDPYDPAARSPIPGLDQFVAETWDLSLYKGRMYLYWGPVPSLLLTVFKVFSAQQVGDQVLVFIFSVGVLVLQTLLLLKIWRRFFHDLPVWTLWVGMSAASLIVPTLWMLGSPRIYGAAILSAQFFFLAGFYSAFSALETETHRTRSLWIAGVLWALAIGSRITSLGGIALVVAAALLFVPFAPQTKKKVEALYPKLAALIALGFPIIVCLALLGWYNQARFDSPLEVGLRYQLTWTDLNRIHDRLFSPQYIAPSLFNYILMPYKIQGSFPFLEGIGSIQPGFVDTLGNQTYFVEQFTAGLLFSAPFLLFACLPVASLMRRLIGAKAGRAPTSLEELLKPLDWMVLSLPGFALISFFVILSYFFVTMRFMADFTFSLALLAAIGFWQGLASIPKLGLKRILYSVSGMLLSTLTVLGSVLLTLSISDELQRATLQVFGRITGLR